VALVVVAQEEVKRAAQHQPLQELQILAEAAEEALGAVVIIKEEVAARAS
tara:strand:+ start:1952 stop:2101 length:150 start_codon:yes stop_codon:yes gene_type:complete